MDLTSLPPMPSAERAKLTSYVIEAAKTAFGDGLVGAIGKGSAFKGDFIPYYSDFDVHLFVDPDQVEMLDARTPALEHALRFQEALGSIEPETYRVSSIQAFVVDAYNYPADWTPPLPGTYSVVYGQAPAWKVPSHDDLYKAAQTFFPRMRQQVPNLIGRFLDKPNSGLAPYVRLVGTCLKPAVYYGATLRGRDPVTVWTEPVGTLLPLLEDEEAEAAFGHFFTLARDWASVRQDPERLRTMLREALAGFERLSMVVAGI